MAHDIINDTDSIETKEWISALKNVLQYSGAMRANFLLKTLYTQLSLKGIASDININTPYCNTIAVSEEARKPGDSLLEEKILNLIRWNAIAMVVRAGQIDGDLGGHIGTFASAATLYDVGFNHFWQANNATQAGDLIYFQGHASPGMYARSFLEGVLTEDQLIHFRREVHSKGLSSYPHPWLMPSYWQFPTVSMGLGPLQAIYQARFMRYLAARNLSDTGARHVWCFCGDGEMDEPESLGALTVAGREKLDNLIFVINCNLQRLDGPVRGNGSIIQELEAVFKGAGWNVIKVVWGHSWDPLFAKDKKGALLKIMNETVDGEYQNYKAHGGAYTRAQFFGKCKEAAALVEDLSDDEIRHLNRGGHDAQKVYAAYHKAVHHTGQPTVILTKTVKGYGLGTAGEALNTAHNTKKMAVEQLKAFRDRFQIPVSDAELEKVPFYKPSEKSEEIKYLKAQRKALGGFIPSRRLQSSHTLKIPTLSSFEAQLKDSGERKLSTTMAFVRLLTTLTKDKNIGPYIVPIIPDEARTFGMEGLFRQLGIYAHTGQLYKPVDAEQVMFYKEAKDGQILEEGINEGGAFCSWLAAATSYSVHNVPLIPFYIYYSMFGFQRVGDLAWAAGDSRARGFLIGATAGRTTLNGEGLQHEDGHSHLLANTIPNCISYDPTFSYELAVIIHSGMQRMMQNNEDVFYYITTMNENYTHPGITSGMEENIVKGMYCFQSLINKKNNMHVHLLGSGTIFLEVIAAAKILQDNYQCNVTIWSVVSFNEVTREGQAIERWNRMHPNATPKVPFVTELLKTKSGPVIAATDYMKLLAEQIRAFVPGPYTVLGTDGFGRSDTREALRDFFEVNRYYIVLAALQALNQDGKISTAVCSQAMQDYAINPDKINPMTV